MDILNDSIPQICLNYSYISLGLDTISLHFKNYALLAPKNDHHELKKGHGKGY
jgi:hypothetical protein